MLEFLLDNIFVVFDGQIFQQTIGIPMGTKCVLLLADLFLYSYEAEFIQGLLKSGKKKLAQSFNFTYRYTDDVLSLSNSKFSDYLDFIYPSELEIKDTTEFTKSTSAKLSTKLYNKRDDFNFPIVNFPFLCGNIPASPAYGVFVSQLIRYALYHDFILRARQLATKLLTQGYLKPRLMSTIKMFYGRHYQLVASYTVSVTQFICDIFETC